MLFSERPAFQQLVRHALLRGATVAYLIFAIASLALALRYSGGLTLLLAAIFFCGAVVFWQCSRWLARNEHIRLAVRLSAAVLLFVTTVYSLTAPAKLPGASATVFILVLLFSSFADTRRGAWTFYVLCSLLHIGVVWVRQQWYGVNVSDDLLLSLTVYLFTPLLFAIFTFIATDFSYYVRQMLRTSVGLRRDLHSRTLEYQVLLETMNEGFIVIDEHDRFAFVNSRFCEIVGLGHDQLLGQSYHEFAELTPANRDSLAAQRTLRRQNQRSTYELPMRRRDGRKITLLISAIPNMDEEGVYFGASCVVSDITERKEAEAALRAERAQLSQSVAERTASLQKANEALAYELSERQQAEQAVRAAEMEYRLLFNHVPIGLYRADMDGKILRANPALAHITGYEDETALLAALHDRAGAWYVDSQRREEFRQLLLAEGRVTNFESKVQRVDTLQQIWISENAGVIRDATGKARYYQGVIEDITERKQVALHQERLITELARVAQMKNEFLANISHELRTPLNGILTLTELLREQIYGPLGSRQQKALVTITESGEHLLSLINDILDLAKMEAAQVELNPAPFDLNSVCQASMKFVQTAAQTKKIRVYFTPDDDVTTIIADEMRVKQILINLLNNAVKFTPERGAIGLEVFGVHEPQPLVNLVVWDTGVGISPESVDAIFRPFVQLDSRLARQHEGSGLGLALVQQFAQMHGGSVTVESQEERGSRFTVSLPWRMLESQTPDLADASVETGASNAALLTDEPLSEPRTDNAPLILIAAQEAATRQMFADYLRFKHYQVLPVDGLEQVIAVTALHEPALIIVDIPLLAGQSEKTIARLRNTTGLAQVPIILLATPTHESKAILLPERNTPAHVENELATIRLNKPVSLQDLVAAIENQLCTDKEPA